MKLVNTHNIDTMLTEGLQPLKVASFAKRSGGNGTYYHADLGDNFVGIRFTHIVLDSKEFLQLMRDPDLGIRTLAKHFRPQS